LHIYMQCTLYSVLRSGAKKIIEEQARKHEGAI
jgi:hypothetical protein